MERTFKSFWQETPCYNASTKMKCYVLTKNDLASSLCKGYKMWVKNREKFGPNKSLYAIVKYNDNIATTLPFKNKENQQYSVPGCIIYIGKGFFYYDDHQRLYCRGNSHQSDDVFNLVKEEPDKYGVYVFLDTIIEHTAKHLEGYSISWLINEEFPRYTECGFTEICLNKQMPKFECLTAIAFKKYLTYDYNKTRQK